MSEDQRTDAQRKQDIEATWESLLAESDTWDEAEARCKAHGLSSDAIDAVRQVWLRHSYLQDAVDLQATAEALQSHHRKRLDQLKADYEHLIAHIEWKRPENAGLKSARPVYIYDWDANKTNELIPRNLKARTLEEQRSLVDSALEPSFSKLLGALYEAGTVAAMSKATDTELEAMRLKDQPQQTSDEFLRIINGALPEISLKAVESIVEAIRRALRFDEQQST